MIKGSDNSGKMLAYSTDKINDPASAFRVENICPGSKCSAEIRDVFLYSFN